MKTSRTILKFAASGLAVVVLWLVAVLISSPHSPTVDILGSYFPAWMVCILSGLALTLIAHWIVQMGNLKPYISPAPLIYSCLMIIFTFATWILFYEN
jgi:YtcA family